MSYPYDECQVVQINTSPAVYWVPVPFKDAIADGVNCFVIIDGEDQLIVDVGPHTEEARHVWLRAIDELHLDHPTVFLTHLHADHAGLLETDTFGSSPVIVSQENYHDYLVKMSHAYLVDLRDKRLREGIPAEEVADLETLGVSYYTALSDAASLRFVHEGDIVRVGAYSLHVIDTSGHTPGHISLFEPLSGLMFGGDHVLYVISPVLGTQMGATKVLNVYLENLSKVSALDVSLLCHSHGPLIDDGRARTEWIRAHHLKRAQRGYEVVAERPGLTGNELIHGMRWNLRGLTWEQTPVGLKSCVVESAMVTIDYLVNTGQVYREECDGIYRYHV